MVFECFSMVFLWCFYGFSLIFNGFPMVLLLFLLIFNGSPMVLLWFLIDFQWSSYGASMVFN